MDARNHADTETLRDRTRIIIRALRPENGEALLQAMARGSGIASQRENA
ncbi:hypothetical protein JJB11_19420 [Ramlibacter ginsenosidimutans]|uniref:Uncharacterized protein n=1 Tax=Ramlibacter ginsenosidimutans TaxID=502333 RepID=A0A934TWD9_9BURK|nr:hypothetical protein [Ramlibacter ginsenosidimutans]MBK6008281.1 hypothetical protein [Ramlibacter ginsenosidimutans]